MCKHILCASAQKVVDSHRHSRIGLECKVVTIGCYITFCVCLGERDGIVNLAACHSVEIKILFFFDWVARNE